jgi:hypothetical protein
MTNLKKLLLYLVLTLTLTIIHHVYGAYIYKDSFRLHVVFAALPILVVLLLSYRTMLRSHSSVVRMISLGLFISSGALSAIGIGLYEGGYNHLVKNILYFTGTPVEILNRLYPSIYELPNNFLFEFSGILQFVTGVFCLVYAHRTNFRKSITVPDHI